MIARGISPTTIRLRQNCRTLIMKLAGFNAIVGTQPVLAQRVANALEEAAGLYLRARPSGAKPSDGLWSEAQQRIGIALDEAMAQLLTLAEPESVAAQEAELGRGWAEPLIEEMRVLAKTVEAHRTGANSALLADERMGPLAGLRNARHELQRLDSALSELEQETHG
jgi:hypothetical protein